MIVLPAQPCEPGAVPLLIAANVDDVDHDYFEREIRPLLAHPLVEYIGEIGAERKERVPGISARC